MGRVLFSIWAFLFGVALLIWYAIDGWMGVFKAVLAMCGLGLVIACILRRRHERKPGEPPAWVPVEMPRPRYLVESEQTAAQAWRQWPVLSEEE